MARRLPAVALLLVVAGADVIPTKGPADRRLVERAAALGREAGPLGYFSGVRLRREHGAELHVVRTQRGGREDRLHRMRRAAQRSGRSRLHCSPLSLGQVFDAVDDYGAVRPLQRVSHGGGGGF